MLEFLFGTYLFSNFSKSQTKTTCIIFLNVFVLSDGLLLVIFLFMDGDRNKFEMYKIYWILLLIE